jgi:hypothetical protein
MKLEDIKIGGVYKVVNDKCRTYSCVNGAYIRVNTIDSSYLRYDILNAAFEKQDLCSGCLKAEDLEPINSIEGIKKGDIVIRSETYARTVLERVGDLVALSLAADYQGLWGWFTIAEMKENNWTIKTPELEKSIEELTVEEISKRLGYSVKIVK